MSKWIVSISIVLLPALAYADMRIMEESFRTTVSVAHAGCKGSEACYELAKRLEAKAKDKVRRELSGACDKMATSYFAKKGKLESLLIYDVDILPGESDSSQATFMVGGKIRCALFSE